MFDQVHIKQVDIRAKMKAILYLPLLFSISSHLCAMGKKRVFMECDMPSEQELKSIICKGNEHFCEKTRLPNKLEKSKLHPLGVATTVELALYDYQKYMEKSGSNSRIVMDIMHSRKKEMVKNILANCQCYWKGHAYPDEVTQELVGYLKQQD
jgi:hypothetical protein